MRNPAAAMEYLVRRQRKAILEKCRRIAIVGASTDPDDATIDVEYSTSTSPHTRRPSGRLNRL
jgi:predicted CoA-binding protein